MGKIISFKELHQNFRLEKNRYMLFKISTKPGTVLGSCCDCGQDVEIRKPWVELPFLKNSDYIVHCKNCDCENYYGSMISYKSEKENTLEFVSFVNWSLA